MWLLPTLLPAQTSFISGVINAYSAVTAVNPTNASLTLSNPGPFAFGDRVLLIQMQGAVINEGNTSGFGTVTDLNGAGGYEFATICDQAGSVVALENQLVNTYDPANGAVQLVRIPQYVDVVVNGTLLAQPWNGATGGILAFEATGTVQLQADIDLRGAGFRGGTFINSNLACNFLSTSPAYFYTFGSEEGGAKGEGIARLIANKECGRGPQVQGGGGGNSHNSGAGGGGHFGAGGLGGDRVGTGFFPCRGDWPGQGGRSLAGFSYGAGGNRLFAGGGGGAGHGNNSEGTDGGDGGGIVLLRANLFDGNGFTIRADGRDAVDGDSDGGAGGGGGGAIALFVNAYTANPLTLSVTGGDGANTAINCEGPGGGGGGGVIWSSVALPGTATRLTAGGAAGIATAPTCGSSSQGATAGAAGTELAGFTPAEGINAAPCILPVVLRHASAEATPTGILLRWETGMELNFARTHIERRTATGAFEWLAQVSATGSDSRYRWEDRQPLPGPNTYRLRLEDVDGSVQLSPLLEAHWVAAWTLEVPPQPWDRLHTQVIRLRGEAGTGFRLQLLDLQGRVVWAENGQLAGGASTTAIAAGRLAAGTYWLRGQVGGELFAQRIRVQ